MHFYHNYQFYVHNFILDSINIYSKIYTNDIIIHYSILIYFSVSLSSIISYSFLLSLYPSFILFLINYNLIPFHHYSIQLTSSLIFFISLSLFPLYHYSLPILIISHIQSMIISILIYHQLHYLKIFLHHQIHLLPLNYSLISSNKQIIYSNYP